MTGQPLLTALGKYYDEHVLRGKPVEVSVIPIKQLIANDADIKAEALQRRINLDERLTPS